MVAASDTAISFQKALIIASGPAMLEKIVRPLKEEGMSVNACENLADARNLYRDQALIILPLKEENREETKQFIAWLRESPQPPFILAVGRCDEKYRQSVVTSFQLNDLITLPYTEGEVRNRLGSYRQWCRLPEPPRRETPRPPADGASSLSFFAPAPTLAASKAEEPPEITYCREAPIGIAMFDRQLRYVFSNPRWERQFNIKEPVLGRTQFEVFPNLHPDWSKIYQNCLDGETRRGREVITSAEGVPIDMRWEVRPWHYLSGQIGGITIAFEEVWQAHEGPTAEPSGPAKETASVSANSVWDLTNPVVLLDRKGVIKKANAAAAELARVPLGGGEMGFESAFPSTQRELLDKMLAGTGEAQDWPLTSLEPFCPQDSAAGFLAWSNVVQQEAGGAMSGVLRVGVFLVNLALPMRPLSLALTNDRAVPQATDQPPDIRDFRDEALDARPEPIWRSDESGEMKFFNQAWLTLRGRPLERELNGGWLDGLHPSDAARTRAAIVQILEDKEQAEITFRLKTATDDFARLRLWLHVYQEADGAGVLGLCQLANPADTSPVALLPAATVPEPNLSAELVARAEKAETEALQMRRELATLREQNEARVSQDKTFSASPAMLWAMSARGELTFLNRQWERFRGKKLGEEAPAAWLEGLPDPAERQKLSAELSQAAEEGMAVKARFHWSNAEGQKRLMELQAVPVLDSEGLSKGLTGTMRDVTEESTTLGLVRDLVAPEQNERDLTTAEIFGRLAEKLPAWRAGQEQSKKDAAAFREIFDHAAVGIALLGPKGEPLFTNQRHRELLGFGIEETADFEGWLRRGCPDGKHAQEVIRVWQSDIWQRQLTKILTLTNATGVLRDIQIQPQLFLNDNRLLLTITDVTDSKRGEEALRDSEIRFRALFRDSAVGIALVDAEHKVYDVNPALERILSIPRRQLLCRDFDEYIHAEDLPRKKALLDQLLGSPKRSAHLEVRLAAREGEEQPTWVRLQLSLVRDADQRVLFTAYFIHDITEQKQVQAQLQVSQEQNRALLEAIPDLILLVDRQGQVIDFLPSDNVPIIQDEQDAIGRPVEQLIPAFAGQMIRLVDEAFRDDDIVHFRFEGRDSGQAKRYEARIVACKPLHAVVTIQDASERSHTPDTIRLQAMGFASAPDPAILTSYRGEVLDWNPAAEQLLGYPKTEATSLTLPALFGVESMDAFSKLLSENGQTGRWEGKARLQKKDGQSVVMEVVFQPLKSPGGALSGQVIFLREPRDPAPPLEEIRAEVKAESLARMIPQMHERLCANLQIIGTLLNLQCKTQREPEARAALRISRNRVRALTMLHELIRTREDEEAVSFRRYAEILSDELLTSYDAIDRVTVHLQMQDTLLDMHIATPLALILNELLTNAIVHGFPENQAGKVVVGLEMRGDHGQLMIRDNGAGQKPTAKGNKPAGLGLHITQNLAKQIGGTLEKVEAQDTEYRVHFTAAIRR